MQKQISTRRKLSSRPIPLFFISLVPLRFAASSSMLHNRKALCLTVLPIKGMPLFTFSINFFILFLSISHMTSRCMDTGGLFLK